jgi:hypothetical protein
MAHVHEHISESKTAVHRGCGLLGIPRSSLTSTPRPPRRHHGQDLRPIPDSEAVEAFYSRPNIESSPRPVASHLTAPRKDSKAPSFVLSVSEPETHDVTASGYAGPSGTRTPIRIDMAGSVPAVEASPLSDKASTRSPGSLKTYVRPENLHGLFIQPDLPRQVTHNMIETLPTFANKKSKSKLFAVNTADTGNCRLAAAYLVGEHLHLFRTEPSQLMHILLSSIVVNKHVKLQQIAISGDHVVAWGAQGQNKTVSDVRTQWSHC